jgi:hypothetical protein
MAQPVIDDVVSDSTVQKVVADLVTGDLKKIDVAVIGKEIVTATVAEVETVINGKDIGCSCCGWLWTLKISHGTTPSSQPITAASS